MFLPAMSVRECIPADGARPAWVLGALLLLAIAGAVRAADVHEVTGGVAEAHHDLSTRADSRQAPEDPDKIPLEINEALRSSREALTTSNLVDPREKRLELKRKELQTRLDAARRLSKQHNYKDAEHLLSSLLEESAPEDLNRTALLELALLAEKQGLSARAQQIFSQYLVRYPEDASVPEVLLRQGLLYRQMGAGSLALAKFYGVMSASLRLRSNQMSYYKRLVLQAQTEIAETYYQQGDHQAAVEFLARLLKLEEPDLNKSQILYKLVRSLAALGESEEVILQGEAFLHQFPEADEVAEVHFLLAETLQKLGRPTEAKQHVLAILETEHANASRNPAEWVYWQQKAGNQIANMLYLEGDYADALQIYSALAGLNAKPDWQLPVWYQMALIYERLEQPQEATRLYDQILAHHPDPETEVASATLKEIIRMAQWRQEFLGWQARAETTTEQLKRPFVPPAPPSS